MDSNPSTHANGDSLQFDRAEPLESGSAAGITCVGCKQSITTAYFEFKESILCQKCKEAFDAAMTGGSRSARFFRALAMGFVAALICAAGWYVIVAVTGYELGLVAVIVGAAVGIAVRSGSRGRGGWVYQGMAIFLTYVAIATSYVPALISGILESEIDRESSLLRSNKERAGIAISRDGSVKLNNHACSTEEALQELERLKSVDGFVMYYREGRGETDPPPSAKVLGEKSDGLRLPVVNCSNSDFREADRSLISFRKVKLPGQVILLGIALGIAVAVPFLSLPSNAIGLLIIGFALWEAWKINKRPIIHVTGPHFLNVGSTPLASSAFASPSDGGGCTPVSNLTTQ